MRKIFATAIISTPVQPIGDATEALRTLEHFASDFAEGNRQVCAEAVALVRELGWTAEPSVAVVSDVDYLDIELRLSQPMGSDAELREIDRALEASGLAGERWGLAVSDSGTLDDNAVRADVGFYADGGVLR